MKTGGFKWQKGLALVVVLWVVAALGLLAGGLVAVSRAGIRGAQTHTSLVQASALGDAAIQLAALDWQHNPPEPVRRVVRQYEFAGHLIPVTLTPAGGFIDLNGASQALLRDLMVIAGGLDASAADSLAQRIIDWRDADQAALPQGGETEAYLAAGVASRPRNGSFQTPEDLMQVLGIELDLFARIQPFVTVWNDAGRGVDPLAAPPDVLVILAGGDQEKAAQFASRRDQGGVAPDATRLQQAYLSGSRSGTLLVEAIVNTADGFPVRRARWIRLGAEGDGTPWQTLSTEPARFVSAPSAD